MSIPIIETGNTVIQVPVWILSLLLTIVITGGGILVAWGVVKTKIDRAVEDINDLWEKKVDKGEFEKVYNELTSIKDLLNSHISAGK
jgi:hypothetical protein